MDGMATMIDPMRVDAGSNTGPTFGYWGSQGAFYSLSGVLGVETGVDSVQMTPYQSGVGMTKVAAFGYNHV